MMDRINSQSSGKRKFLQDTPKNEEKELENQIFKEIDQLILEEERIERISLSTPALPNWNQINNMGVASGMGAGTNPQFANNTFNNFGQFSNSSNNNNNNGGSSNSIFNQQQQHQYLMSLQQPQHFSSGNLPSFANTTPNNSGYSNHSSGFSSLTTSSNTSTSSVTSNGGDGIEVLDDDSSIPQSHQSTVYSTRNRSKTAYTKSAIQQQYLQYQQLLRQQQQQQQPNNNNNGNNNGGGDNKKSNSFLPSFLTRSNSSGNLNNNSNNSQNNSNSNSTTNSNKNSLSSIPTQSQSSLTSLMDAVGSPQSSSSSGSMSITSLVNPDSLQPQPHPGFSPNPSPQTSQNFNISFSNINLNQTSSGNLNNIIDAAVELSKQQQQQQSNGNNSNNIPSNQHSISNYNNPNSQLLSANNQQPPTSPQPQRSISPTSPTSPYASYKLYNEQMLQQQQSIPQHQSSIGNLLSVLNGQVSQHGSLSGLNTMLNGWVWVKNKQSIVIIGPSNIGKSFLVNSILRSSFIPTNGGSKPILSIHRSTNNNNNNQNNNNQNNNSNNQSQNYNNNQQQQEYPSYFLLNKLKNHLAQNSQPVKIDQRFELDEKFYHAMNWTGERELEMESIYKTSQFMHTKAANSINDNHTFILPQGRLGSAQLYRVSYGTTCELLVEFIGERELRSVLWELHQSEGDRSGMHPRRLEYLSWVYSSVVEGATMTAGKIQIVNNGSVQSLWDLPLLENVKQLLGKTVQFKGLGRGDHNLDRVYIREKLKEMLSGYGFITASFHVKVPSSVLLSKREITVLSDDTRRGHITKFNITRVLDDADQIFIAIDYRGLSTDMADLLISSKFIQKLTNESAVQFIELGEQYQNKQSYPKGIYNSKGLIIHQLKKLYRNARNVNFDQILDNFKLIQLMPLLCASVELNKTLPLDYRTAGFTSMKHLKEHTNIPQLIRLMQKSKQPTWSTQHNLLDKFKENVTKKSSILLHYLKGNDSQTSQNMQYTATTTSQQQSSTQFSSRQSSTQFSTTQQTSSQDQSMIDDQISPHSSTGSQTTLSPQSSTGSKMMIEEENRLSSSFREHLHINKQQQLQIQQQLQKYHSTQGNQQNGNTIDQPIITVYTNSVATIISPQPVNNQSNPSPSSVNASSIPSSLQQYLQATQPEQQSPRSNNWRNQYSQYKNISGSPSGMDRITTSFRTRFAGWKRKLLTFVSSETSESVFFTKVSECEVCAKLEWDRFKTTSSDHTTTVAELCSNIYATRNGIINNGNSELYNSPAYNPVILLCKPLISWTPQFWRENVVDRISQLEEEVMVFSRTLLSDISKLLINKIAMSNEETNQLVKLLQYCQSATDRNIRNRLAATKSYFEQNMTVLIYSLCVETLCTELSLKVSDSKTTVSYHDLIEKCFHSVPMMASSKIQQKLLEILKYAISSLDSIEKHLEHTMQYLLNSPFRLKRQQAQKPVVDFTSVVIENYINLVDPTLPPTLQSKSINGTTAPQLVINVDTHNILTSPSKQQITNISGSNNNHVNNSFKLPLASNSNGNTLSQNNNNNQKSPIVIDQDVMQVEDFIPTKKIKSNNQPASSSISIIDLDSVMNGNQNQNQQQNHQQQLQQQQNTQQQRNGFLPMLSNKTPQTVATLLQLCIVKVCQQIHTLTTLRGTSIPEELLQKVITLLINQDRVVQGGGGVCTISNQLDDMLLSRLLNPTMVSLDLEGARLITGQSLKSISNVCVSLRKLSLAFCTNIQSEALSFIGNGCKSLESINLRGCYQLSAAGILAFVRGCNNLLVADFSGCIKVTDSVVHELVQSNRKLQTLDLRKCVQLTDAAFQSFNINSLLNIDLLECSFITDQACINIINHSKLLNSIKLSGKSITDHTLYRLAQRCRMITSIDLVMCESITDKGVQSILKVSSMLQSLNLCSSKGVSSASFQMGDDDDSTHSSFGTLSSNQNSVGSMMIDDDESSSHSTTAISVSSGLTNSFTGSLLQHQRCWRNLTHLDLNRCASINDNAVLTFTMYATKLETLSLAWCEDITDEAIMTVSVRCSQLKNIDLTKCKHITDASVSELAKTKNLQLNRLVLFSCSQITDRSVVDVATYCHSLIHLDLSQCEKVSDVSLVKIAQGLPQLRVLCMEECVITDTGVQALGAISQGYGCRHLEVVKFGYCRFISDSALERISTGCPNVSNLDLSYCSNLITPRGIKSAIKAWPKLHTLRLRGYIPLSIESLLEVPALKLKTVNLSWCANLEDATLIKFAKSCPVLENLDISRCPKITDNALESIIDCCPSIRMVNVSGCKEITSFSVQKLSSLGKSIYR